MQPRKALDGRFPSWYHIEYIFYKEVERKRTHQRRYEEAERHEASEDADLSP